MFKALARNVMGKSGNPAEKLEKICKETGNVEKLDALLNSHPAELFLNVRFQGQSALHLAVRHNFPQCVQLLLRRGAMDVNAKTDDTFETPLHLALQLPSRSLEMVRALFEAKPDVKPNLNVFSKSGMTVMHLVCSQGNMDVLKYLCAKGGKASVREQNTNQSCLHKAAIHGHAPVAQYLLQDPSVSVDEVEGQFGYTALHFAARHGRESVVEVLLQSGADATVRDAKGATAIDMVGEAATEASSSSKFNGIREKLQKAMALKIQSREAVAVASVADDVESKVVSTTSLKMAEPTDVAAICVPDASDNMHSEEDSSASLLPATTNENVVASAVVASSPEVADIDHDGDIGEATSQEPETMIEAAPALHVEAEQVPSQPAENQPPEQTASETAQSENVSTEQTPSQQAQTENALPEQTLPEQAQTSTENHGAEDVTVLHSSVNDNASQLVMQESVSEPVPVTRSESLTIKTNEPAESKSPISPPSDEDSFAARTRRWQEQAKKSSMNILLDSMSLSTTQAKTETPRKRSTSNAEASATPTVEAATAENVDGVPQPQLTPTVRFSPVTLTPPIHQQSDDATADTVVQAPSPRGIGNAVGSSPIKSTLQHEPEGETLEQKIHRIMSATALLSSPSPAVSSSSPAVSTPAVTSSSPVVQEPDVSDMKVSAEEAQQTLAADAEADSAAVVSSPQQPVAVATPKKVVTIVDDKPVDTAQSHDPVVGSAGKKKLRHVFSVEGMVQKRLAHQSSRHGYLDDFAEDPMSKSRMAINTWEEDADDDDDPPTNMTDTDYGDGVHQIQSMEDEFQTPPASALPAGSSTANKTAAAAAAVAVDTQKPDDVSIEIPAQQPAKVVSETASTPKGGRIVRNVKIEDSNYTSPTSTNPSSENASSAANTESTPAPITPKLARSKSGSQLNKPKTPRLNAAELDAEIAAAKAEAHSWSRVRRSDSSRSIVPKETKVASPTDSKANGGNGDNDELQSPVRQVTSEIPVETRPLPVSAPASVPASSSIENRSSTSAFTPTTPMSESSPTNGTPRNRLIGVSKQKMAGSVKLLAVIAKWQGRHNFKNICRAFFRWTELVQSQAPRNVKASPSNRPADAEGEDHNSTGWVDSDGPGSEEDLLEGLGDMDPSMTYAGGYGNGRFAASLSALCSWHARFHLTDVQLAKAKAFLMWKFGDTAVKHHPVPSPAKRLCKANEPSLWPLFIHYTNPDLVVPNSKSSAGHRKKKLMGLNQLWQLLRDCQISPDVIGKLQLENLMNEVCDPQSASPAMANQQQMAQVWGDEFDDIVTGYGNNSNSNNGNEGRAKVVPNTAVVSPLRSGSAGLSRTSPPAFLSPSSPKAGAGKSAGRLQAIKSPPEAKPFNRMDSLRASILSPSNSNQNLAAAANRANDRHCLLSFDTFVKLLWRLAVEFLEAPMLGATSRMVILLRKIDTSDIRKSILQKSTRSTTLKVPPFILSEFTAGARARAILDAVQEEEYEAYRGNENGDYDDEEDY